MRPLSGELLPIVFADQILQPGQDDEGIFIPRIFDVASVEIPFIWELKDTDKNATVRFE